MHIIRVAIPAASFSWTDLVFCPFRIGGLWERTTVDNHVVTTLGIGKDTPVHADAMGLIELLNRSTGHDHMTGPTK
jgi:hypothetical protein